MLFTQEEFFFVTNTEMIPGICFFLPRRRYLAIPTSKVVSLASAPLFIPETKSHRTFYLGLLCFGRSATRKGHAFENALFNYFLSDRKDTAGCLFVVFKWHFCEESQGRISSLCFLCFLASHFSLLNLPKLTFLYSFGMLSPLAGLLIYRDLKFGTSIGGHKLDKKGTHVLNVLSGL